MRVLCSTDFSLVSHEVAGLADPQPNRDDVLVWLREIPNNAQIQVDWNTRSKLVAVWIEER